MRQSGRAAGAASVAIVASLDAVLCARLIRSDSGRKFDSNRELALLDQEARSATVEADDDLVCYVISRGSFDHLTRDHPAITIKPLTHLGRELSSRLRRANRTIYQLAS